MEKTPGLLTIVVPTYRRNPDVTSCLDSVRKNSAFDNEIIVMAPESEPELIDICRTYTAHLLEDGSRRGDRRTKSLWAILNQGIEASKGEFVCWLNDDCEVNPNWDRIALSYFRSGVGLVVLKTKGIAGGGEYQIVQTFLGSLCANYAILRKSTGLRFDEKFSWYFGDADISLQAEKSGVCAVVGTEENLVVHSHRLDESRHENERDPRAEMDFRHFYGKWRYWKREGGALHPMRVPEVVRQALHSARVDVSSRIKRLIGRKRG